MTRRSTSESSSLRLPRVGLALFGLWLLFSSSLAGCATLPPPRVLSQADQARSSPAAEQAKELAPQAFLRAKQLHESAEQAYQKDDYAGAQVLGEQAIAAYAQAVAQARAIVARKALGEAEQRLEKAKLELASLEAEELKLAAETEDTEMRAQALRDALAPMPSGPASPEREQARRKSARFLIAEARLLCISSELVSGDAKATEQSQKKLGELDAALEKGVSPTPIDTAVQLRAECLKHLTLARRPKSAEAPESALVDALLAELSEHGAWFVFRDDRGVVVTLREVFERGAASLTANAEKDLDALGRIAKAHPAFPLLVVMHGAGGPGTERQHQAIVARLQGAGAAKVATHSAGGALPVLPSRSAQNERVEIVFVAPVS